MDPGVIAVFIPIVAIVMGIGIGMMAIWSEHKRKAQLLEQVHKERLAAIEKGVDAPAIPAGLVGFQPSDKVPTFARALRSGVIWSLVGVALYFAVDNAGGREGAMFALIPLAIGIGQLVYAGLLWSKEKSGDVRPL